MISTRWLWRYVGTGALLATALCVFGFGYGINQIMFPKAAAIEPDGAPAAQTPDPAAAETSGGAWETKSKIQIVAIGDSLTAGTGDLTGRGYVGQVKDLLAARLGKPVYVVNNFAIPGYRTTDMLQDWEARQDVARSVGQADLVLLTAGGNDLFAGGQGIFTGGATGEGFNPQAAAERMPEALKRLGQLFEHIHAANPNVRVLYVGLYHPFLDLDETREGSKLVEQWNSGAFALANRYPNFVTVPTYDLFALNLNRYLYTDHFHPNQDGYSRIASRIVDIIQ